MSIDLNEWVRFDQPGTYQVTVNSRRLTDLTKKRVSFLGDPVSAKPFMLHIIPVTPAWQAAKLQAILSQLAAAPATQGVQPPERKAAIADLRFLGTTGALKELAANLREDRPDILYQSAFGLMGVPESMVDTALKPMEQRLEDPSFPVSGWFIQAVAAIEAPSNFHSESFAEERGRAQQVVWQKVLGALPRKEGTARAATVKTLLENPPRDLDPESKSELARVLSASFQDLTEEQRTTQLRWQWDLLRSPSMLPALQASAKLPLTHPGSNLSNIYARRDLKSAALARWYELDPAGATEEIALQIGSSTPSLTAQALSFLPMQAFPQFEPVWVQRLAESSDDEEESVLGGLLVRFGTGAASAEVAGKLRSKVGTWACAPQAAALAYLVKFDPTQARPLLQSAVDAAGPGKTGCNQNLFQDVSAHASGEALTDIAVASLDNANSRVVMDALIYLTSHGRKQDQAPIWTRYTKWSDQWSGKADTLDSQDPSLRQQNYADIGLGENLASALIANQGWLADKTLITQVLKMCVGQQLCPHIQQVAALASPPYRVTLSPVALVENYQIAQYSPKTLELLDQKINQYPKGTIFQLIRSTPQNSDQQLLENEAKELFEKSGMSLQVAH